MNRPVDSSAISWVRIESRDDRQVGENSMDAIYVNSSEGFRDIVGSLIPKITISPPSGASSELSISVELAGEACRWIRSAVNFRPKRPFFDVSRGITCHIERQQVHRLRRKPRTVNSETSSREQSPVPLHRGTIHVWRDRDSLESLSRDRMISVRITGVHMSSPSQPQLVDLTARGELPGNNTCNIERSR